MHSEKNVNNILGIDKNGQVEQISQDAVTAIPLSGGLMGSFAPMTTTKRRGISPGALSRLLFCFHFLKSQIWFN
ncbi:MAG: hypothetical protein JL50_01255 [Peptococcaceae bacterium BICA1-7]|nr:MAG: hypothetical protein JL50_01255 [Peptococcaceae bacterium BICA1-7]HBV97983.1 hypothetical protein [Desulfotomaculum sp.]